MLERLHKKIENTKERASHLVKKVGFVGFSLTAAGVTVYESSNSAQADLISAGLGGALSGATTLGMEQHRSDSDDTTIRNINLCLGSITGASSILSAVTGAPVEIVSFLAGHAFTSISTTVAQIVYENRRRDDSDGQK